MPEIRHFYYFVHTSLLTNVCFCDIFFCFTLHCLSLSEVCSGARKLGRCDWHLLIHLALWINSSTSHSRGQRQWCRIRSDKLRVRYRLCPRPSNFQKTMFCTAMYISTWDLHWRTKQERQHGRHHILLHFLAHEPGQLDRYVAVTNSPTGEGEVLWNENISSLGPLLQLSFLLRRNDWE